MTLAPALLVTPSVTLMAPEVTSVVSPAKEAEARFTAFNGWESLYESALAEPLRLAVALTGVVVLWTPIAARLCRRFAVLRPDAGRAHGCFQCARSSMSSATTSSVLDRLLRPLQRSSAAVI